MQKNSITNKITPCCGLPFSVMYWFIQNITLSSETDRSFIFSKLRTDGSLPVNAWTVLINSGTLEADAGLNKQQFLEIFNCRKKPTCAELKLIIEGYKVGNWNPNNELPENISQLIEEQVSSQIGSLTGASKTYHEEVFGDKVLHVFDGWKKNDGTLIDYQNSEIGKYISDGGFTSDKNLAINYNLSFITKEYQSDNLFDKTNYVDNKFFPYTDVGHKYINIAADATGWFISSKITVSPGKAYYANTAFGFFDENETLIAAFPNSNVVPQIAPPTAVAVRVTSQKVILDSIYFAEEKNQDFAFSSLKKQSGQKTISKDLLPPSVLSRKGNNLVVSIRGGGDFRHINDAIDWLRNSGENDAYNPFTFEIIDGVYVESVNMIGLFLTLKGRNKENCIIKNYLNDYYNPPIDMASNNHLFDLTIHSDGNAQTPVNGLNNLPSYGIHFDIASRYENLGGKIQGRSIVKNCRVIGKYQHAVGQGLWTNQYSEWDDCEFISYGKASFRSHNYLPSGATNQQLFVRNCRFSNPRWNAGTEANPEMVNWAIMLQDANVAGGNENTDTVFTFQNNVAWCEVDANPQTGLLYRHTPTASGNVAGKIKLGGGSFGNNIAELNF